VGIATLSGAFRYLTAVPEAFENFRHVGHFQHLRVLLGSIGRVAGPIVLLLPRLRPLKEPVYAGFTFLWIAFGEWRRRGLRRSRANAS
jgi:hypothetical protein